MREDIVCYLVAKELQDDSIYKNARGFYDDKNP